ncbi:MAG TPA: nucleotidyl transferase AbiEii/AbiGii toxin family protein [Acidobacteriota bacterium]
MQAFDFWKTMVADKVDFLERLIALLRDHRIGFCVIGGQAVNAYVEPLVSLDLDLAIATGQIEKLGRLLGPPFRVERFSHSLNVALSGSDLRVQIQTDPRYASFPQRAETREVLGLSLPVARVEDVLLGKIWAASDTTRRASKRQKDLADLARLVEAFPHLRKQVPADLLARLV